MDKPFKLILLVLAVPLVIVATYGLLSATVESLPITATSVGLFIFIGVLIAAVLLSVPYWLLKFGFFVAHDNNRREKELHMRDIPKDQDQIAHQKS